MCSSNDIYTIDLCVLKNICSQSSAKSFIRMESALPNPNEIWINNEMMKTSPHGTNIRAYIYLLMRHASSKLCILPTCIPCDHSQDSLALLEDEAEPKMLVVSSLSSIIIMYLSFRDMLRV